MSGEVRRLSQLGLVLLLVLSSIGAGAEGDTQPQRLTDLTSDGLTVERGAFHTAGCYADPTGDVVRAPEGTPEDDARADIAEFCVSYTPTETAFSVTVPGGTDPSTDPGWAGNDAGMALLYRDVDGAQRELQISTQNNDGVINYLVLEGAFSPRVVCQGPASFQPGGIYVATVPADCFNGGPTIEVTAVALYDGRDDGLIDLAPYGGGAVAIPQQEPAGADRITRLAGAGRAETAVEVSRAAFADGAAGAVLLASQNNFPDAVVGAPLAAAVDAPVLLTRLNVIPVPVMDEIERVLPPDGTVYILGGTSAVGEDVDATLEDAGFTVQRLAGDGRTDTALRIAEETIAVRAEAPRRILIAPGGDFPEALLAGAYAPGLDGIALLVNQTSIPQDVQAFIDQYADATVLGVGADARPLAGDGWTGSTPAHTSALMARSVFGYTAVSAATYEDFPDGLAGGAFAARNEIPLLLTPRDSAEAEVLDLLELRGPFESITVIGGSAAVSRTVAGQFAEFLT